MVKRLIPALAVVILTGAVSTPLPMFIGTLKTDGSGEVRRDPDTNAAVVEDNGGC